MDLVESEYGIAMVPGRYRSAEAAVERRIADSGFGSAGQYLRFLRSDPGAGAELLFLACEVANHETYFFREPGHLLLLKERLEEVHRKGGPANRTIRLLSAGCSTGEEAYSMAAAVCETGLFGWGAWQVEVLGVDLDPASVEFARRGIYSEYSMRGVDPGKVRIWFQDLGGGNFRVKEKLRDIVRFVSRNILHPPAREEEGQFHMIFCRNVLIYMAPEAAAALIGHLHARLAPEGWLLIGHSETLLHRRDLFEPLRRGETVVYVRRGERKNR